MSGLRIRVIIENDEDVLMALKQAADEHNITFGVIEEGRGKIRDVNITLTKSGGRMTPTSFADEVHLFSLHGKVERGNDGMQCRLSATLMQEDKTKVNGQLLKAKAVGDVNVVIKKSDTGKIIEA
jgi:predicted DNA-binding protein with PD1-like motif